MAMKWSLMNQIMRNQITRTSKVPWVNDLLANTSQKKQIHATISLGSKYSPSGSPSPIFTCEAWVVPTDASHFGKVSEQTFLCWSLSETRSGAATPTQRSVGGSMKKNGNPMANSMAAQIQSGAMKSYNEMLRAKFVGDPKSKCCKNDRVCQTQPQWNRL